MEELVELLSTKDSNGRLSSSITSILVHEFPDLAFLPLLANERHPAIGHKAMHQETDAPAEQRPECPIDAGGGHEADKVQEQIDRDEDSKVNVEGPNLTDTTACTPVALLIVGYRRRHRDAIKATLEPGARQFGSRSLSWPQPVEPWRCYPALVSGKTRCQRRP